MRDLTLLVTGGAGFFGRAFTRHALDAGARRVIAFSDNEKSRTAMRAAFTDPRVDFFLGNVRDERALRRACQAWHLDAVIHAGAMKQIDACEEAPQDVLQTNVVGSANVIEAALAVGVPRVMGISTDKAVEALTVYGASKAMMERLFVAGNIYRGTHGTRFSCVRYGNVIGSTDSVIPKWRGQAARGEALTVTDPEMTRFWWTIEEAVAFTARAVVEMQGGEIFVPKLLACRMGDLASALSPSQVVTGTRANEKRHEILIAPDEPVRDAGWAWVIQAGQPAFGMAYRSDGVPRIPVEEVLA